MKQNENKKVNKMLLKAFIKALISFAIIAGAFFAYFSISYGWLSNSVFNTVDGIHVTMNSNASVVVGNLQTETGSIAVDSSSPFSVNASRVSSSFVTRYVPATHDYRTADASETLLLYNPYPYEVDLDTGLGIADESGDASEITLLDVPEDNNSTYYVDYVLYIASLDKSVQDAQLIARITDTLDRATYRGATTVDFYVDGVYKDTLNVAQYDRSLNDHSTEKSSAVLCDDVSIPLNDDGCIEILMRCYFDGALLKDDTHTFITRNALRNTENPSPLKVQFSVVGGSEE